MNFNMLPVISRHYILTGLNNTSATLSALLARLPTDAPTWNLRPQPDRFSLREIIAHLADWEEVFRDRYERTVNEDHPHILRPELEQRAEERGYAHADPVECLARFQEKRAALTAWLGSLPDDAWVRLSHLDRIGDISVNGLIGVTLAHDAYHIRQITEWLASA